ncbi:hypothetical protein A3B87_00110 [Candidatus Kuenenbacteria bacterium RIFCSPHIGHO2_02_FULL_39_13]|uniref:N-acetyltransferase domain-containing protein n=1 Tax=Candidatus Kuenenbacteria bacterium RIFCSPHIGHO2_02_FULL_39_13 TaxID=1798561 RepID=A0A1F6FN41_9BACT|nr:MAG: hypothetical protein A3B87_00110 [Candidatus Kuenenbacteria bacterium RIFCSPHIGHO2_02_FULL_39_13]
MNNNYTIRPAQKSDSRRVWEIRNHPIFRKYSGNSEFIPLKSHEPWFENKYFSGLNNYCYVLVIEPKVIGYCRLDFNAGKNGYTISIALDPDHHGQGLGYKLLNKSLNLFNQLANNKDILAEIQKENIPSIKLFQKNNFKIYKEDDKNYYLKYKTI